MTLDEQLINQIVGHVMEQLRAPADPAEPPQIATSTEEHDIVVVSDKVVTAELLEERLGGRRNAAIAEDSLLTPSARDFLSSHNVRWCRKPLTAGETSSSCVWMALVVETTPHVNAVLDDAARAAGIDWKRELPGSVEEAVSQAVGGLCRSSAAGAVILTGQPEAAACRANRNPRVRAAALYDAARVRRIRAGMGTNLFCIDPDGLSYTELRNLLREAVSGGTPQPPDGWND